MGDSPEGLIHDCLTAVVDAAFEMIDTAVFEMEKMLLKKTNVAILGCCIIEY